jgi:hypothetical protein
VTDSALKLMATEGSGFLGRYVLLVSGRNRFQPPVHAAHVAGEVPASAERRAATKRIYDVARSKPMTFTKPLRKSACAAASRTRLIPVRLSDEAVRDLDSAHRSFAEGILAEARAMGPAAPAGSTI